MKTPERFKIKYEFKHMGKGFSAPIDLLANLEYIEDRLKELRACYQPLAKKIGEINIASRDGAYDFDIANSLVGYYALTAINLNIKKECLLNGGKDKYVYSDAQARRINSRFD